MEDDVLAEEAARATIVEDKEVEDKDLLTEKANDEIKIMKFKKSQLARHLKPLYIKAYIDG